MRMLRVQFLSVAPILSITIEYFMSKRKIKIKIIPNKNFSQNCEIFVSLPYMNGYITYKWTPHLPQFEYFSDQFTLLDAGSYSKRKYEKQVYDQLNGKKLKYEILKKSASTHNYEVLSFFKTLFAKI